MAQIHALTPEGRLPSQAQEHVREMVPHPIQDVATATDWVHAEADETGQIARAIDSQGRTWLRVHPDSPGMVDPVIADQLKTMAVNDWVWAVADESGQVALGVRADGTVHPAGGNGSTAEPYDVVLVAGQSNAKGTGYPLISEEPMRGIDQFPAANKPEAGQIIPAVEPLLHQGPITHLTGTGFAIPFAKAYLREHPGRRVLIVPSAFGATGFSTSAPAQGGTWDWTAPDDGTNLALNALRQTQDALAAAGPGARLVGILWHQGEGDGGIAAQYAGYLDGLIAWWRTELGLPDLPVVIGQMVPERPGFEIDHIHQQTPSRVERTAFAPTPPGLHNPDDRAHLSTRAHQIVGPRMQQALTRAGFNFAGVKPIGVENLTAAHTGDTITVSWDPAWCRVTDYRVEWRLPGGAWGTSGVAHTPPLATSATFPAPAGGVEIRVTTVNETGESIPVLTSTAGSASPATASVKITPTADWQADVQTDITAMRSGNVVTIAAWRLAVNTGVTGDVVAYVIPEGYRPPSLFVDDTEDSRGANVVLGADNTVTITDPSGSVSHHSFTYITNDPFPA